MLDRLAEIERRYEELERLVADPTVIANRREFAKLARERSQLEETVARWRERQRVAREVEEHRECLREKDAELRELARRAPPALDARLAPLDAPLKPLLLPRDPNDERNTVLEIRAGTGGDEASLFAAELFRMYSRYAERHGWRVEVLSSSPTGLGGFKEVIALVQGKGAFSRLKFEGGVHRVQRAAERDRRQSQGDGRLWRPLGEDPHLQLPAEPGDRPPCQPDPPHPRPRARRRHRPDRGRARRAPAGRGAGGGGLMGAAAAFVTLGDALAAAIARLAAAGVPEPRADALARELPAARVWASDVDTDALAVARANLARQAPGVALVCGDLLAPFRTAAFDLVAANPPYVADAELGGLAPEVRDHEPRVALAAGPDGLAALGRLMAEAPRVLAPGGWLVVEVGAGQAAAVRRLADEAGAEKRQAGRPGLGPAARAARAFVRSARGARAPGGAPAEEAGAGRRQAGRRGLGAAG